MELNEQQAIAVNHKNGPLLIIAGAGTGKTKVITERIAKIVNEKWAKPNEILALTFTEKAASEMQQRVDALLPLNYEEPWISTFHSFCDKILRQEASYIGLDSNYKLMTPSQSYILFRKNIFKFPLKYFRPLGNPTKFITDILSHFSRLADEQVLPEQYLKWAKKLIETSESEKEFKEESLELANTYKEYLDVKVANSKLDFGDLIITTLKLFLEKPNILKKYHNQFKYILVDEYQDTNYTQNVLVNLLALGKEQSKATEDEKKKANITVVGDDDQAIYKFRGAAISNIMQFKQVYSKAKSVVLTTNYRSNQEILDTAYRLIKNNNPYRLEVTEKIDKKLVSTSSPVNDAVRLIVENKSADEAERIAKEVLQLTGKSKEINTEFDEKGQASFDENGGKYKYNDIAILVRANNHAEEIIQNLRHFGIPYKLGNAKSLYQRREIAQLIAFLKTLADYSDEVSLFNILSMEEWELLPREVVEIIKYARKVRITTFEAIERVVGKKAGSENEKKEALNISSKAKIKLKL